MQTSASGGRAVVVLGAVAAVVALGMVGRLLPQGDPYYTGACVAYGVAYAAVMGYLLVGCRSRAHPLTNACTAARPWATAGTVAALHAIPMVVDARLWQRVTGTTRDDHTYTMMVVLVVGSLLAQLTVAFAGKEYGLSLCPTKSFFTDDGWEASPKEVMLRNSRVGGYAVLALLSATGVGVLHVMADEARTQAVRKAGDVQAAQDEAKKPANGWDVATTACWTLLGLALRGLVGFASSQASWMRLLAWMFLYGGLVVATHFVYKGAKHADRAWLMLLSLCLVLTASHMEYMTQGRWWTPDPQCT